MASSVDWGDVPSWVEAGATLAVGVGAAYAAHRHFKLSGFAPTVSATLDTARHRLAIEVVNTGRTSGSLQSASAHGKGRAELIAANVVGLDNAAQIPQTQLPPGSALVLILQPAEGAFPADLAVTLGFGNGTDVTLEVPTSSNLDLTGSVSQFPQ